MKEEEVNITDRACPACAGRTANAAGEKHGFKILVCDRCRSIFTSALPAVAEQPDYDDYYHPADLEIPDFITRRIGEIVSQFEPFRKTGRLLDLGFGAGSILEAGNAQGWEVHGTEVSHVAVENVRQRGFNVFEGTLEEAAYSEDYFDVVTASEIVEHLPDPRAVLIEIRRILRPGGVFWGTTPSARSLSFRTLGARWSTVCPPDHLQLYSAKGISRILADAGFSDIRVRTRGFNPYEILTALKARGFDVQAPAAVDAGTRVATSRSLNEKFSRNLFTRGAKSAINGLLGLTGLGDSLSIVAVK